MSKSSKISGFYKLSPARRLDMVKEYADLTDEECEAISGHVFGTEQADTMIENVIGTFELPVGIATNFLLNGTDRLIPMSVEEASVVAAASKAASIAREGGGFQCSSTEPIMIGQIQLTDIADPYGARMTIFKHRDEILKLANEQDPVLVKFGGGARDMEVRVLDTITGPMVIVHLLVDCRDAMGANAVNTMNEAVAPYLEKITGGRYYLRIISNLAVHRLARARAVFPKGALGGANVVDGIIEAYAFARADPFRASTHNKGIMNGVSAVVRATGNDTRAVEAGAHTYAAMNGYGPLTTYEKNKDGDLVGTIEIPVAVGLIGGAVKVHPVARAAVKILGIKSAGELGEVLAAVGLAQNLGAMRALATEGIQRGHMKLHARNMAATAGATPDIIDDVVAKVVKEGAVRMDVIEKAIAEVKKEKGLE